ncbi:MAG: M24 family metallopeptidase, partial [Rhodospirillaceae bacterium]|nr:M24 family metallopeptidase [Rhodospirillaceae bacterium]
MTQLGRFFPNEEYEARWTAVEAEMRRRGLETAVVFGRSGGTNDRCGDVLYLTNFFSTASGQGYDSPIFEGRSFNSVLLRLGEKPELHADEPGIRAELISTDRIISSNSPFRDIARTVKALGIEGPVGLVGSDVVPLRYWNVMREEAPDIDWQIEDDLILAVRRIKSAREQDAMRIGGETASRALNRFVEVLIMGRSEAEAAAEASHEVVKSGGTVHFLPACHGDLINQFVANPIAAYTFEAPREGDLVRAWVYGPMFEGYYQDPGRTTVCGKKPRSAEQKEMVETGARIVEAVMEQIRPGRKVKEVAQHGRDLSRQFGAESNQMAEKWPHFGHGLGLFFERPYLGV